MTTKHTIIPIDDLKLIQVEPFGFEFNNEQLEKISTELIEAQKRGERSIPIYPGDQGLSSCDMHQSKGFKKALERELPGYTISKGTNGRFEIGWADITEHAINLILDETDPTSLTLVEIEDDEGKSLNIGQRRRYGNYTKLRITAADIKGA